jgi:RimJ/RimL family protein N-acetyltransferase
MILERTTDVALIKSIIEHPEIAPLIFEGEAQVPIHDSIYYLVAKEGIVAFIPINSISWNPHIAVLPEYRGKGTELMQSGLEWMFKNTECKKVVAFPPSYNKPMIRVFEKCGFKQEGFSPNSFMFKGQIYDRLLLGIER